MLQPKDLHQHCYGSPLPSPATGRANEHNRLLCLSVMSFLGLSSQWLTFWDSFRSVVCKTPEISNIDKFSYLRNLLSRSAGMTIDGLPSMSANYEAVIELQASDNQESDYQQSQG